MLGCFSEGDGVQLCLEPWSLDLWPHANCPQFTCWKRRNPELWWMREYMSLGSECTSADGQCFIYRLTRTSSSFPKLEAKRGGGVFCELLIGDSLTSKMTAQDNPSQPLILPKGLWKQHLVVIYAKWEKGRVWRQKLWNKLMHVELLMSAGWWKLTWCIALSVVFLL